MFDLAEWVETRLERARTSTGHEWTAECPFCGRYGGFYVNTDPTGRGPWVCFKCDERSTTAIKLVARVEDLTPMEARALVLKSSVEFRRRETTESLAERIRAIRTPDDISSIDLLGTVESRALPEGYIPVWDGKRWRVPVYLTKRGFKRSILRAWSVGYCDTGYFRHRVIIPLSCPGGESFTARDLTGAQEPRYLNPKGADHNRMLFGWNRVPRDSDFVLVEGPLDAMKLDQHGLPSMAVGGKVLHAAQLAMLFTRPRSAAVTVMLDPEAHVEAHSVAAQLIVYYERVYVAQLPEGVDPGASSREQAHKTYGEAVRYTGERLGRVLAAVRKSRSKLQGRFEK